jgi:cob(I)alamin adenosyltransferase
MSIVTKTGDKGQTGLFGGQRVSKADQRIHAYGTIDELNAVLGITIAKKELPGELTKQLERTQNMLFRMGADLATPREGNAKVPRIQQEHIDEIEKWINGMEAAANLPPYFVLPGGTEVASLLHLARTVCRRAERWIVALAQEQDVGKECTVYANRLSDYLFLAALEANRAAGLENVKVNYE